MYRRIPAWACDKYGEHGDHAVCERCQENFRANGSKTEYRDMPPHAEFGRGWFSVGAVHYFEATDATVFPSRDGKRVLAAAFCGGICERIVPRAGSSHCLAPELGVATKIAF